jgi:hypothetical protein
MDRIRPTQASTLIEALRKLSKTRPSAGGTDAEETSGAEARANLSDQLRALAEGVDLGSDQALRAIQPRMIRCILQHEWGPGVEGDPALAGIVDAVNDAINRDPRLQAVVREALQSARSRG